MAKAKGVVKGVVTGVGSIDRKLKRLAPRVQKKVARQSIRAGMKLVLARTKAEAPVDKGILRSHVKLQVTPKRKIKKGEKGSTIAMEVVVENAPELRRRTKAGKTYFYPALVQYGGKGHDADPFGTRAFRGSGDAARRATIARLKVGVDREIKALSGP